MSAREQTTNNGRLAMVTGASSGIGYELAILCAKDGFDLLVVSDSSKIEEAAKQFQNYGVQVQAVQADLATREGVDKFYNAASGRQVHDEWRRRCGERVQEQGDVHRGFRAWLRPRQIATRGTKKPTKAQKHICFAFVLFVCFFVPLVAYFNVIRTPPRINIGGPTVNTGVLLI